METIFVRKNLNVGYPCTPSRWVGEPQYRKITRIRMSCGGGMGGASWYEYVERMNEFPAESTISVKRITGEVVTINTRWMVMAENFTLCTVCYNTTNSYNGAGLKKNWFLIKDGQIIRLIPEFDGSHEKNYE